MTAPRTLSEQLRELDLKIADALERAHSAPKCLRGDPEPQIDGDAWARHSREWMKLCDERDAMLKAAQDENTKSPAAGSRPAAGE